MTYDPAGPYVLLFGGSSKSDTWTFADGRWTELNLSVSPSVRVWSNMAYDVKDGYVLLFGGLSGSTKPEFFYDTWTFSSGIWTNITTTVGTPPNYSYGSSTAYDSEDRYVLLFGGLHPGKFSNETWTYSGGHWRNITATAGTPPPCRFDASLADDPAAGYVLLFGGNDGNPATCPSKSPITVFDDSWSFVAGKWKELSPEDSPPASWMASMAYDSETGNILLFGGVAAKSFAMADTWTYLVHGGIGNWVKVPLTVYPPARFSAMIAYDAPDGYFVLIGGLSETYVDSPLLADAWTFNGSAWTNLTVSPVPSPRFSMALTYNPNGEFVLMFGGEGQTGVLGDTWKFAGGSWFELKPPLSPSARYGASMAYDAQDGYTVLFGGIGPSGTLLNDTWVFEWGKTEWVELTPSISPSPRYNASVAFDAKDGYLLLFGGMGVNGLLGDTWRFVGGAWTELTPSTSPSPRCAASATYDASAEEMLLFGGQGSAGPLRDTWAFSGGNWTELSGGGSGSPTARYGASLAYDPNSGSELLLGGSSRSGLAGGEWTFTGGSWEKLSLSDSPASRFGAGLTFDGIDSMMLLVGGGNSSSTGFSADSWTYSNSGWTQMTYPAVFSETGLPRGTAWDASVGFPEAQSKLSDLLLSLPADPYEYQIDPPIGWLVIGASAFGSLVITGSGEPTVSVDFGRLYDTNFTESGLKAHTSWEVQFDGSAWTSTATTIHADAPNGTYAYTVSVTGNGSVTGSLTVNGEAVNVTISYHEVTFDETGLPALTDWSVTTNDVTKSSTANRIAFYLPNGTYLYDIGLVPGYHTTETGTVTVSTGGVTTHVSFSVTKYQVKFTESGLRNGAAWEVTFGGTMKASTGRAITFSVPNGTYPFDASATGYDASPSTGNLTVADAALIQSVTFVAS